MTTQTPSPTDNERLRGLEGEVRQMNLRFSDLASRLTDGQNNLQSQINNLRLIVFAGFGLIWATMVGGFIAILSAIANINP